MIDSRTLIAEWEAIEELMDLHQTIGDAHIKHKLEIYSSHILQANMVLEKAINVAIDEYSKLLNNPPKVLPPPSILAAEEAKQTPKANDTPPPFPIDLAAADSNLMSIATDLLNPNDLHHVLKDTPEDQPNNVIETVVVDLDGHPIEEKPLELNVDLSTGEILPEPETDASNPPVVEKATQNEAKVLDESVGPETILSDDDDLPF